MKQETISFPLQKVDRVLVKNWKLIVEGVVLQITITWPIFRDIRALYIVQNIRFKDLPLFKDSFSYERLSTINIDATFR